MKGLRSLFLAAEGLALSIVNAGAQTATPAPSSSSTTVQLPTIDVFSTTPLVGHRRRHRQGSRRGHHDRLRADRRRRKSPSIVKALQAADAERRRPGRRGQSISARRLFSRLRRLAGFRHAAGARGLSERHAHQRSVRRHRQLGPDPDRRR